VTLDFADLWSEPQASQTKPVDSWIESQPAVSPRTYHTMTVTLDFADLWSEPRTGGMVLKGVQPIIHNGRLAALIAGRRAIIGDSVPDRDLPTIKAMCLYALEVRGPAPGPPTAPLVHSHDAAANTLALQREAG
jgi:hypothetical protein